MYKLSIGLPKDEMKPALGLIPLIIIFQFVVNTSVGIAWSLPRDLQTIPAGVTVNGNEIGGMTQNQAIAYLAKNNSDLLIDREFVLQYGDREWLLKTKDFGYYYDYQKTIDTFMADTQGDKSPAKIINIMKLQARDNDLPLEVSWNDQKLNRFLNSINEEIVIPAQDARLSYRNGSIVTKKAQSGEEIDVLSTAASIVRSIQRDDTKPINIVTKELSPRITGKDLEPINGALAVFDTLLNSDNNRNENIVLASQLIDGTIIMPGEIFSFNDTVGERNTAKGFKPAPIILGGAIQRDIGGGICQVATTLYNASLLAGLEIVERAPHSVPVKYAPEGKDATVFYGLIDFKFKNSSLYPIIINSKVENNTLAITILGNKRENDGFYNDNNQS